MCHSWPRWGTDLGRLITNCFDNINLLDIKTVNGQTLSHFIPGSDSFFELNETPTTPDAILFYFEHCSVCVQQ